MSAILRSGQGVLGALSALAIVSLGFSALAATPVYKAEAGIWIRGEVGPIAAPSSVSPADLPDNAMRSRAAWEFASNVPLHATSESGQHLWPDVAWSATGLVGAAWMDDHDTGGYHIFYTQSADGGATWSAPEKVDDRTTGAYSKFVDMEFTPAGIPVLVWEDDRTGQINLYLSRRDPGGGGTPWTANVRVNTAGGPPYGSDYMNPSLAVVDDQRFFVAWTDWREGVFYQVYSRSTADGGATWGTEHRVSDELGYQPVAGDPCLITASDAGAPPGAEVLYCVTNDWRGNVPGGRYPNVYFYRSGDGGQTWSVGVRVNDIEPLYQQVSSHALVRLNDGSLVAGWLNDTDLTSHLRTCYSTDEGANWSASLQVDAADPPSSGTGTFSAIACAQGTVFAVFDLYVDSWDAYFRASADGARSWSEPMRRMDDASSETPTNNPALAAASTEHVVGVWSDGREPGFNWKIYAAVGELSMTGVSQEPVAEAGGGVHIIATPNPAPAGASVRLSIVGLPAAREIALFDTAGRRVRSLMLSAGSALWDGKDASGLPVASGVYWARTSAAPRVTERIVVIR
jgi:hypothetical protein